MKYEIKKSKVTSSRIDEVDFDNVVFGSVFSDHMFVADYIDGKWQNISIKPFERLTMSPANLTLHYGQTIFEGMKATKDFDGLPLLFRPEQHAQRFNVSAYRMGMPEVPEALFLQALEELVGLDANWIPNTTDGALYIRPFMIATDEVLGVRPSDTYRFMVITGPVNKYYNDPVKLLVANKYVRAVKGGVGEAKTGGNYAATLMPMKKAREAGYDQIMWMDAHEFKYVQECGTMNLFFVINDIVITPPTEGAILKGITRNSILTLLREKGYKVEERKISIDELLEASDKGILQDVFGSGTAAVVAPVALLGYEDKKMIIPPLETRHISKWVKSEIQGIRKGTIEDRHNWLHHIPMSVNEKEINV